MAKHHARYRDGAWPVVFTGPLLAGIALFYLYPVVMTVWNSLQHYGAFGRKSFSGLDNYRLMLTDPATFRAVLNTVAYTAVLLLGIFIATYLADLLSRPGLRFAAVYRVLFFLPYVAMPVAVALVWRLIYNGDFGVLNWLLGLVGIPGVYWLSTEWVALLAVAIVGLWMSLGFNIIILSAGRAGIPAEIYDAAAIDGASKWTVFTRITVPLLSPTIFFCTTVSVINSFQMFDLLFAMISKVNPVLNDSRTLVYLFYDVSFVQNDKGLGSAIAVLIFVVVGALTWLQFRLQRRWVTYA